MSVRRSDRSTTPAEVRIVDAEGIQSVPDELATEEPLEIRLRVDGAPRSVAVTMRTPGADEELAAGFLFNEGIVARRDEIVRIVPPSTIRGSERENVVEVELVPGLAPDLAPLERHFFATSACGICGKASLDTLLIDHQPLADGAGPRVAPSVLSALPERLRRDQGLFGITGGLHAAALFDADGELVATREDIGRHNALDKLLGWAFLEGRLPLADGIVLVSGRASYEILQKSLMARAPIVCAVSAASSLAVSLAREFGITLVGFLREGRFNVYSRADRILDADERASD
jgi:FdhD protein